MLQDLGGNTEIVCGTGYVSYYIDGPSRSINCTNADNNVYFRPLLPEGLSYNNGIISGSPEELHQLSRFSVIGMMDSGILFITCSSSYMY